MRAKVLFVDDEPIVLALGEEVLSNARGIRVLTATNGPEALSVCASDGPDLVFLDVMMPGMDGYEVCRAIKADEATRGTKVVVLTAFAQSSTKHAAEAAGADGYMTKPFKPTELLGKVREMLGD